MLYFYIDIVCKNKHPTQTNKLGVLITRIFPSQHRNKVLYIPEPQFGFREKDCTAEHVVRFACEIRHSSSESIDILLVFLFPSSKVQ